MRRLMWIAVPLALTLLVAACTASNPRPMTTASPTPSPSPSPSTPAATALARLAALSAKSSYSATYTVTGTSPGTARIVRTPNGYRFELTTGVTGNRRKAVLIRTTGGTVSCTVVPTPLTCLRVAGPGKPVPPIFDAGLQHVFSDYLVALSRPSSTYRVAIAVAGASGGECFDVTTVASTAPDTAVASGVYCIGTDGIPTRVAYPSGEIVLTARGPSPKPSDFTPPAKPKSLP